MQFSNNPFAVDEALAELSRLPQDAALAILEKLDCEQSLHSFLKEAWKVIVPTKFVDSWHIQAICEHLEAVSYGQIKKLAILVPPRFSKTLVTSVIWPAWVWSQERDEELPLIGPQCRFMCVTYAQNKSDEDAIRARNLLTSLWYQAHWGDRVTLSPDLNTIEHFANTNGGERMSASWGGSILGRGGDIKIIDDPHKVDEAESDKVRENVITSYKEGLQSRVTDPKIAAEVLVMQRLHFEDLANTWIEQNDATILCLPAEYDSLRHCKTYVNGSLFFEDPRQKDGEPLWPEQWPPEQLEKFKLMPYVWSGQYQQMPVPRAGGVIPETMWEVWPPDWWPMERGREYPPMEYVVASLDTAFTEKKENDECALTVWGIWRDDGSSRDVAVSTGVFTDVPTMPEDQRAKIMLMYAWHKRCTLHGSGEPPDIAMIYQAEADWYEAAARRGHTETTCPSCSAKVGSQHRGDCTLLLEKRQKHWGVVEWTTYLCKRFRVNTLLIENTANGKPVAEELFRLTRDMTWNVELVTPQGDKISRAHAVYPLFANGRIWGPIHRDWARIVVDQLVSLGKTRHDDAADSCLVSGTMIATRRGDVPIEDVVVGDEVVTPVGFRKVAWSGQTGIKPIVRRQGLSGTIGHPVFVYDRGWVGLGTVAETDNMGRLSTCGLIRTILRNQWNSTASPSGSWVAEENTTLAPQREPRTVRGQKDYTLQSGRMLAVSRFRKSTKSIISTGIRLTVALRTLSVYRSRCIVACLRKMVLNVTERFSMPSGLWLPLGTEAALGTRGIFSTGKKRRRLSMPVSGHHWRERLQSLAGACGVALKLWLTTETENSVQAPAPLKIVVFGAENTSGNTPTTPQPVFNLSVEEAECYYANGVLAHNCTMALHFLREHRLAVLPGEEDMVYEAEWKTPRRTGALYDV